MLCVLASLYSLRNQRKFLNIITDTWAGLYWSGPDSIAVDGKRSGLIYRYVLRESLKRTTTETWDASDHQN